MRFVVTLVFIVMAQLQAPVYAHSHESSAAIAEAAHGEVRKVDRAAKKLTIRHGPIQSLDMPGMTMVFQVKDPAVLDQLKSGDKVRFTAEKVDGAYTVTQIEVTR